MGTRNTLKSPQGSVAYFLCQAFPKRAHFVHISCTMVSRKKKKQVQRQPRNILATFIRFVFHRPSAATNERDPEDEQEHGESGAQGRDDGCEHCVPANPLNIHHCRSRSRQCAPLHLILSLSSHLTDIQRIAFAAKSA